MGCGSSKPDYYDQNAPRPMQSGGPPPPNAYPQNGYPPNAYPPPQQQQQPIQQGKTKKQKGVKAASNLGLLSILAG